MFLEYKMSILYSINYSLDFIFSNLVVDLSEKFFINNVFKLFYNKLILISSSLELVDNYLEINSLINIDIININVFYIFLNK
jgi:hypothetical protein